MKVIGKRTYFSFIIPYELRDSINKLSNAYGRVTSETVRRMMHYYTLHHAQIETELAKIKLDELLEEG